MTNEELNERAAKAMGWTKHDFYDEWVDAEGNYVGHGRYSGSGIHMPGDWSPATSHDDARVVEDRIEQKGLWLQYIGTLEQFLSFDSDIEKEWSDESWCFEILRLSPYQKTLAAVTVLEANQESTDGPETLAPGDCTE
jgi:hypothetical protein